MDFLSAEQKKRIIRNNARLRGDPDPVQVERVKRLSKIYKEAKSIANPVKLTSDAIKKITGHGPAYYISNAIKKMERRSMARTGIKQAAGDAVNLSGYNGIPGWSKLVALGAGAYLVCKFLQRR